MAEATLRLIMPSDKPLVCISSNNIDEHCHAHPSGKLRWPHSRATENSAATANLSRPPLLCISLTLPTLIVSDR
eukprot:4919221-Karenia_brevis.AAC.1